MQHSMSFRRVDASLERNKKSTYNQVQRVSRETIHDINHAKGSSDGRATLPLRCPMTPFARGQYGEPSQVFTDAIFIPQQMGGGTRHTAQNSSTVLG